MDALEKRTIFWFTVHTTPNHNPLKMDFPPETFLKSTLLRNGLCGIQLRPPNSSLLFWLIILLCNYGIQSGRLLDQDIYCNLK